MFDLLKKLCEIPGVSGREQAVAQAIIDEAKPYTDDITVDALGNVLVRKKGAKTPKQPILLAAHMDEVGFMVNEITKDGLVKFVAVGGLYGQTLAGRTLFFPRSGLRAVLGRAPMHLSRDREKVLELDNLYADIGAKDQAEAEQHIRLGDTAVFDTELRRFGDDLLIGKALDDRLGCVMLLQLLKQELAYDATFAFTVQEELGLRGATTAAFGVRPGSAIVVDVGGGADNAGFSGADVIACVGKGPIISFADNATFYDSALYESVTELADKNGIPWQTKSRISGGTDAGAIHKAAGGSRVVGVSICGRNIHTAASAVSLSDIDNALELLTLTLEHLGDVC